MSFGFQDSEYRAIEKVVVSIMSCREVWNAPENPPCKGRKDNGMEGLRRVAEVIMIEKAHYVLFVETQDLVTAQKKI